MTPLLLLLLPLLASAEATTGFTRFLAGHSNTSVDSFDPSGGHSLGKVGDKVKNAVNDPWTKYGRQDYFDSMGVADAWSVQKANNPIPITTLVADFGITAQHEDLKNKLATDNQGRHGYNFISGTDDITDSEGHGTCMAGIVAAEVNNSKGIAGVDPLGRILTGKVGNTVFDDIASARAVDYAVTNGAQVVLLAFGNYDQTSGMKSIRDAMWKAQQSKNTFFVLTAGNDGKDKRRYPCAYRSKYTLCVGASMSDKRMLIPESNYGLDVDVLAPGVWIASTSKTSPETYSTAIGTSPAAAIVAGVVSLMLSVRIEAVRIKDLILDTCDNLEPFPKRQISDKGGFVNATRALRKGLGLPL